jgi:hypothetical protein
MAVSDKSSVGPEVLGVLRQLRFRIQRYVALEGVALVLVVAGVAFWISLGVDYWLELSVSLRRFLLTLTIGTVVAALLWYLVLRLVRDFRSRELALILERRFPGLHDRLITAVELAESRETLSPLTAAMLRQTADEAAAMARTLELRRVFSPGPLVRAGGGAFVLAVSIVAFGWAGSEVLSTWFRRNVLMADDLYRRDTDLEVVVLADPGERVVEFRDGTYRHPRGADLNFRASVPEGKLVPEQVRYDYRNIEDSGRGGDYMTRIGDRQFRQRLAGLHESIHLWLRGGDYSTRAPYRIEVVEPPLVDRIVLRCLYPEYTGLNTREEESTAPVRQEVTVLGTQVSLPAGTDFLLEARCNKPLESVRIQTDLWELRIEGGRGKLALPAASGESPKFVDLPVGGPLLADDRRAFTIPCVLGVGPTIEVISMTGGVHLPLRLAGDAALRITLHDTDDVMSGEPARLIINSIPDEPPHIETRLKGIGKSITRQATIPFVGEIQDPQDGSKRYGVTDDYGIAEARFEYRLDSSKADAAEATYQPAPFASRPEGRRQLPVDEKFQVLPLDLAVGVKFTLKVVASDTDNLTGPHVSSGQPIDFQVVSDDELLALIAVKELNLRRRFEQILEEVRNTRKDLLLHRTRVESARGARRKPEAEREAAERDQLASLDLAVTTSVERAINGIRKNANETQSIEEEFRDIRDELENNAVPDVKPMLGRIDEGIIRPLHSINTVDYNEVDDALVLLRRVLDDQVDPLSRFEEPVDRLNVTIEHLEAVLAQMLKLETVNEALQLLREIIKSQEQLQEETRTERKKKLIEGLK